ncbi:unnamed protein product [Rotaria sp. Silwood2]|nr:unnamed protein product [Rotaria sp. Silwood2]CAF4308017.1 unnamed protein product [Rotaria sp. Silwood2]
MIFFIEGSSQSSIKQWIAKANVHIDSSAISAGTITFIQEDLPLASVRVIGKLNLTSNKKYLGFHVHMFSLPDDQWNCSYAGPHWNPYGTHLHNLTKSSILDKSIVIHQDEDDLGRGNHLDSHTTGHAGDHIACGNIRLVDSGLLPLLF